MTTVEINESFGTYLKTILKQGVGNNDQSKWTQCEFATAIGRHKDTVNNWIRNKTLPNDFDLECIISTLNLDSENLNQVKNNLIRLHQVEADSSGNSFDLSIAKRVVDIVNKNVLLGKYHPLMVIPESDLITRFGARNTAYAIDYLINEGVLHKSEDTVKHRPPVSKSLRNQSFKADHVTADRAPMTQTISLEVADRKDLPLDIKSSFPEKFDKIVRHQFIQIVDQIPHAIGTSYYPYELFPNMIDQIKSGDYDVLNILSDSGHPAVRKRENLKSKSASKTDSQYLLIPEGNSPGVVKIDGFVYSSSNDLIERYQSSSRADLYEFCYDIELTS